MNIWTFTSVFDKANKADAWLGRFFNRSARSWRFLETNEFPTKGRGSAFVQKETFWCGPWSMCFASAAPKSAVWRASLRSLKG